MYIWALCLRRVDSFHPTRTHLQPLEGNIFPVGNSCHKMRSCVLKTQDNWVPYSPKEGGGWVMFFFSRLLFNCISEVLLRFQKRDGSFFFFFSFHVYSVVSLVIVFLIHDYVCFSFNKTFHFCNFAFCLSLFFFSFVSQRSLAFIISILSAFYI